MKSNLDGEGRERCVVNTLPALHAEGSVNSIRKSAAIRLPVNLSRIPRRGALWQAELDVADPGGANPFTAQGRTEADARASLTRLITAGLNRWAKAAALVIGGGPDYATCLHLIVPEPQQWVVHVVRDGQPAGTWHSDHSCDELLRQVLEHVGGQPLVITL